MKSEDIINRKDAIKSISYDSYFGLKFYKRKKELAN